MCIGEEGLITCSSLQESHLREPVECNVGGVVLAEQPLAKGRMIQRVMRIGTAPSLGHMVASDSTFCKTSGVLISEWNLLASSPNPES